jgi:hypothetical protein
LGKGWRARFERERSQRPELAGIAMSFGGRRVLPLRARVNQRVLFFKGSGLQWTAAVLRINTPSCARRLRLSLESPAYSGGRSFPRSDVESGHPVVLPDGQPRTCSKKIDEVSDYFNHRFNATGKSNLHGEKGIREMEADVVRGFEKLVQNYVTLQFMDGLPGMR